LPWIRARFHLDPLAVALAPLAYSFPIDAAIKRFKFQRKLFYGPAFRCLLGQATRELPAEIDALLPMPLHWRRLAVRGFNQAAEISSGVRRAMDLPVVTNVRRIRHTPYQSGLGAAQRRRNLRNAFRVSGPITHRHVLIIDDVITTGETCRELASALTDAGAERVSALAIARAIPG
jgi:ComF family protein